jgi:hypothetical protein
MRIFTLSLLLCLSAIAHAATSDMLFVTGGGTFAGKAGNIVFNGQHFVTPCVQNNGAIHLTFLDTNAVVVSNISLSITGSTPRLAPNGLGYLLAWLDTNASPSLKCAALSSGILGPVFTGETNISEETLSLSAAHEPYLAVFQSGNAVFARQINSDGSLAGVAFSVSPSAQAQVNPSVAADGANRLVCWMEQNIASNDWRVMVQRITIGALNGSPVQVSETNSMRPYQTACSFGTNFLVAWSTDEGPWNVDTNLYGFGGASNVWRPTVHGRMLSQTAVPLGHEFPVLRNFHFNTNVAIAFGDDRYVVTCYNYPSFRQQVQPLSVDGAQREYVFDAMFDPTMGNAGVQIAFGADRYCAIYSQLDGYFRSVTLARRATPDMQFFNVRRTNDSIIADSSVPFGRFEFSTNLIDWQLTDWGTTMPSLSGRRQIFFRQANHTWRCLENLRMLHWAKQQWAMNNFKVAHESPSVSDLVGPTRPLLQMPSCPLGGSYWLGPADTKPACNLAGHSI